MSASGSVQPTRTRPIKYRSSFELVPRGDPVSIAATNYSLGMSSISGEKRRKDSIVLPPLSRRSTAMRPHPPPSTVTDDTDEAIDSNEDTVTVETSPAQSVDVIASPQRKRRPKKRRSQNSRQTTSSDEGTGTVASEPRLVKPTRPDSRHVKDATPPRSPRRLLHVGKDAPPASIERVQRSVLVMVNQLTQEIKNFRLCHLHRTSDVAAAKCKVFATDVLGYVEVDPVLVATPQDWAHLALSDRRLEHTPFKRRSEFEQTEALCQRAAQFDVLMQSIKERIRDSKDHYMDRYFVSYAEETSACEIDCVTSYEANIEVYRSKIEAGYQKVCENYKECQSLQAPNFVTAFLANASTWTQLMTRCCVTVLDMCDVIRRWCHEDRMYPKKLWEVIITGNSHRGKIREEVKRLKRKHEDVAHHISRKESSRGRLQRKIGESKREERKIQASLETVAEKEEKLATELLGHQLEQRRTENLIKMRKTNSPILFDILWKKSDRIKEEMARVQGNLDVIDRHKNRLYKTKAEIGEATHNLEEEATALDCAIAALKQKQEDIVQETGDANGVMGDMTTRICAAKTIREMKLSTGAHRRMHLQRSDDVIKDPLMQACCLVANHIGREWKQLYLLLPFHPQREVNKLRYDVEVTDVAGMRRDQTLAELALHCLQKWRNFHRKGSIPQLARSLRKLRKTELANNVEETFLKAASA